MATAERLPNADQSVDVVVCTSFARFTADAALSEFARVLRPGGYLALALYRMAPERFSAMILADTRATADNEHLHAAKSNRCNYLGGKSGREGRGPSSGGLYS